MPGKIKSFKPIGLLLVQFLSTCDGEDYVENILLQPLAYERGRLFIKKRDRLWSLSCCWGRLWDNAGSSLIFLRQETEVLQLLSTILHTHLLAGRYSKELENILTIRRVPLTPGLHMFELFLNLVLIPELSIEISKAQFRSYKVAEEQFLRFSRRLIQVNILTANICFVKIATAG